MICSAPGCDTRINPANITTLCQKHLFERRAAHLPKCSVCGDKLRKDNKSGKCQRHYNPARLCSCGVKIDRQNKLGKCRACQNPCSGLPADLRAQYDDIIAARRLRPLEAFKVVSEGRGLEFVRPCFLKPRVTIRSADVIRIVSETMLVHPRDIVSRARYGFVIEARAVCAKVMRDAGMSYPQIARRLGASDHTSAMHWVRRYDATAPKRPLMQEAARKAAA